MNTFNQASFTETTSHQQRNPPGGSGGGTVTTTYTINGAYADTSNHELEGLSGTGPGAISFVNGTLGATEENNNGQVVEYVRDPSGNLIAMETFAGGTLSGQETSHYYTTDAIGSVILLTEAGSGGTVTTDDSYSYTPYGDLVTSTGSLYNPWGFAGGYDVDGTDLVKFGDRYYDPQYGAFTQPDPKSTYGNYEYAGDDPINNTDPTGDNILGTVLGIGSTVLGVAGLVADATGVGAPVGAILEGGSVALSVGKTADECSTGGDCAGSAAGTILSGLSFGAGQALGATGEATGNSTLVEPGQLALNTTGVIGDLIGYL